MGGGERVAGRQGVPRCARLRDGWGGAGRGGGETGGGGMGWYAFEMGWGVGWVGGQAGRQVVAEPHRSAVLRCLPRTNQAINITEISV